MHLVKYRFDILNSAVYQVCSELSKVCLHNIIETEGLFRPRCTNVRENTTDEARHEGVISEQNLLYF